MGHVRGALVGIVEGSRETLLEEEGGLLVGGVRGPGVDLHGRLDGVVSFSGVGLVRYGR